MKKLVIFLFIISIVVGSVFISRKDVQIFDVQGVEEVCFVADYQYENASESISCGDKFFNFCSFEEAKNNALKIKDCDAVQFYADEDKLAGILKTIKFIELFSEDIDGLTITYGFSPCYSSAVLIDGKKVNVQIAKRENRVVVGFPMILTGY